MTVHTTWRVSSAKDLAARVVRAGLAITAVKKLYKKRRYMDRAQKVRVLLILKVKDIGFEIRGE